MYGLGNWVVNVDADEFLVYSNMEQHGIADLQAFLASQGQTRMLTPLVDMYSGPEASTAPDAMLLAQAPYFDDISRQGRWSREGTDQPGGEKIAPTEIDNALMRHPAVIEAAAYAVHHPRLGEDVAAAVVLEPGSTVTEDDLRKFLSTQLASFKVPRRAVFQDELPKGSTGELRREKLVGRS
jgi:hypothetical protein